MTMRNWQLRCAELKQRGEYLFKSKLWSDCAFQLDDVTIKAHKLIMAMASPVFSKMFHGERVNSPVPIYDVRPEVFNTLLEYIYSDNLNIESSKDACDLYYAAKKWRLPYIAKECAKYLSEHMSPDNVCHIYQVACESDDAPLQRACEKIFSTKTTEVLNDRSFLHADLATVVKLFSLDPLNIYNELDLYVAAVKYAKKQDKKAERIKALKRLYNNDAVMECSTSKKGQSPAKKPRLDNTNGSQDDGILSRGLQPYASVSPDMETEKDKENTPPWIPRSPGQISQNSHGTASESTESESEADSDVDRDDTQKEKYRDLIKQIRFLTLTPQEFADCGELASLLTESEMLALSMNISSRETSIDLPEGFSTSMVPRTQATKEERARLAAVFRSTIHNFKNIKKYESMPFYLRNCAWTLMIMPTKFIRLEDNIIVAVTCFHDHDKHEWINNTKVKVKFCTHKIVPKHLQKVGLKFDRSNPYPDYTVWMTKFNCDELLDPEHGFIDDFNAVTYKVYVNTVSKPSDSPVPVLRNVETNETSEDSNLQVPRTAPSVSPVVTTAKIALPFVTTSITQSNALKPVPTTLGSLRPSTPLTTSTAAPRPSILPVTCNRTPTETTAKTALPAVTTPIIQSNASKPVTTALGSSKPTTPLNTSIVAPLPSVLPTACNATPSPTSRHTPTDTTAKTSLPAVATPITQSNASKPCYRLITALGSSRPTTPLTTPKEVPRPSVLPAARNATPTPVIINTPTVKTAKTALPSVTTSNTPSNASNPVITAIGSSRPATPLTAPKEGPCPFTLPATCNATPITQLNALKPATPASGSLRHSHTVTTPVSCSSTLPVSYNTTPSPTIKNTPVVTTAKTSLPSLTTPIASLNALKTTSGSLRPPPTLVTTSLAPRPTLPVTCNSMPSPSVKTTHTRPPPIATKPVTSTNTSPAEINANSIRPPKVVSTIPSSHSSPRVTPALSSSRLSPTVTQASLMSRPSPIVTQTATMSRPSTLSHLTTSLTSLRSSKILPAHLSEATSGTMLNPNASSHPSTIITNSSQVCTSNVSTGLLSSSACLMADVTTSHTSINLGKTLPRHQSPSSIKNVPLNSCFKAFAPGPTSRPSGTDVAKTLATHAPSNVTNSNMSLSRSSTNVVTSQSSKTSSPISSMHVTSAITTSLISCASPVLKTPILTPPTSSVAAPSIGLSLALPVVSSTATKLIQICQSSTSPSTATQTPILSTHETLKHTIQSKSYSSPDTVAPQHLPLISKRDLSNPTPSYNIQLLPSTTIAISPTSSTTVVVVTNSVPTTQLPSVSQPSPILPSRSPPVTTSVLSLQPIHARTIPWPTRLTTTLATTHSDFRAPCPTVEVPTLLSLLTDFINKTLTPSTTSDASQSQTARINEPFTTVARPLPVTTAVFSSYPLHAITLSWPSRPSHTVTVMKTPLDKSSTVTSSSSVSSTTKTISNASIALSTFSRTTLKKTSDFRAPCPPVVVPTLRSLLTDLINKTLTPSTSSVASQSQTVTLNEPFSTVARPLPVTTAVFSSYPLHSITLPWPSRPSHTVTVMKTPLDKSSTVTSSSSDPYTTKTISNVSIASSTFSSTTLKKTSDFRAPCPPVEVPTLRSLLTDLLKKTLTPSTTSVASHSQTATIHEPFSTVARPLPVTTAVFSSYPLHSITLSWPSRPSHTVTVMKTPLDKSSTVTSSSSDPSTTKTISNVSITSSTFSSTTLKKTSALILHSRSSDDSEYLEHAPKRMKYDADESNNEKEMTKKEIKLEIKDSENDTGVVKPKSLVRVLSLQELAFAMLGPLDFLYDSLLDDFRAKLATDGSDDNNANYKGNTKEFKSDVPTSVTFKSLVKQPPTLKEIAFSMLIPMIVKDYYDTLFD